MEALFTESQKTERPYTAFAIATLPVIIMLAIPSQYRFPFFDKHFYIVLYCVLSCYGLYLYRIVKLDLNISDEFVSLNYFPFFKRRWHWSEIKQIEVINYDFIGGWGIRYSSKHGIVYNLKGKVGLAIRTKTGRKIVIGTQKGKELMQMLSLQFNTKNLE